MKLRVAGGGVGWGGDHRMVVGKNRVGAEAGFEGQREQSGGGGGALNRKPLKASGGWGR